MYSKIELIEKGINLYEDSTKAKATIKEIARKLSISKVTIYNYFESKSIYHSEIVKHLFKEISNELNELCIMKVPISKKILLFISSVTNFYSSNKHEVVLNLQLDNLLIHDEIKRFRSLYKRSLISIIEEGQYKGQIRTDIKPLIIFYIVDMGIQYFNNNGEYRYEIMNDDYMKEKIVSSISSIIFSESSNILNYAMDPIGQEKDRIMDYYIELGNIGDKKSVDIMMSELEKSKTVVETKFIDFGIGLVEKEEGYNQVHWYLFNGTQIQRNYATLYFIRQGRYDYVKTAYDMGLIDKKQAFS